MWHAHALGYPMHYEIFTALIVLCLRKIIYKLVYIYRYMLLITMRLSTANRSIAIYTLVNIDEYFLVTCVESSPGFKPDEFRNKD